MNLSKKHILSVAGVLEVAHASLDFLGCLDPGDSFVRLDIARHPFMALPVADAASRLLSVAHLRRVARLYLSALPQAISRRTCCVADILSK